MPKARPSAVLIVIGAYAALVISVLGITPLWLDELQQLVAGRESLDALMRWVQVNPGASPLPYLLQRTVASLFGDATFVLRMPAAVCSIVSGVIFALLCGRLGIRMPAVATGLFLALPLQFRYALEARGYSLGVLCTLLSLLLFLRAHERRTGAAAAWYGASVALGLYSQPLTILPVFGELLWLIGERDVNQAAKRFISGAALAGAACYVPWYLLQRHTMERLSLIELYFFSWRQVTPWGFLHELSGGGYVCSAALLIGVGLAFTRRSNLRYRQLLAMVAVAAMAGPVAIDALVNYFFAARQLLFAAPALALCAAGGIESLRERPWARYAVLALFFGAAAVSDFRLATAPKDSLGDQARVLAKDASPDSCIAVAPPNHVAYYVLLAPELERKICAEPPTAPRVLAVMSPYSTKQERGQLSALLAEEYEKVGEVQAGKGEIGDYRRR